MVGLPAAEQTEALQTIAASLRDVVDSAVKTEQNKLDEMQARVPVLRSELSALRDVLGGDVRAVASEDTTMLLVSQYRMLASAIDVAKALRADRCEQRKLKEDRMDGVRAELDGEEGPAPNAPAFSVEPSCDEAGGLSLALLGRLQGCVDVLMDEKAARVVMLQELHAEADALRDTLGYPTEEAASPYNISRAAVAAAEADLATLVGERTKRQAILADCAEYIGELRSKLQIAEAEWTALPSVEEAGLSPAVLAAYNVELERLEQIKSKTLGPLLEAARARLRPLWVQLHLSDAETRRCAAAWSATEHSETTDHLEEELELVEEEEKRLIERVEQTGRVLALMAKRETILEQRADMIANQKDPSRLLNRRDPGRLLREEKLRVAVEKDLPRMNKRLRELASEWSTQYGGGEALTYDGLSVVNILDEQEAGDALEKSEEKMRKEAEMAAKKAEKDKANGAALKAGPAPRTSKSAAPGKGAPVVKGAAAFKAAAKLGAYGSAAAAATAAATTTSSPPPPPPELETATGRPAERALQTLATVQAETTSAERIPTKSVAAEVDGGLPVVS